MRIRPARIGDGPAAINLYRELVGDDVAVADGPLGAKRWAAVVTHSGTTVFVAEDMKDGVIGVLTLHILPNVSFGGQSYGLIENLIVTKAHRGKGVGRSLTEAASKEAWKSDCHQIMLLTGRDQGADEFYAKLGFDPQPKAGMILKRPRMI
ncbi:GNAT family N-acetyltransferase [Rhodobacteraceae bacterium NNCM2]|nr:GNAT family N-acetyltransferase [Coraliihabitans acroporae]